MTNRDGHKVIVAPQTYTRFDPTPVSTTQDTRPSSIHACMKFKWITGYWPHAVLAISVRRVDLLGHHRFQHQRGHFQFLKTLFYLLQLLLYGSELLECGESESQERTNCCMSRFCELTLTRPSFLLARSTHSREII
jgi:hypothetical protein